MVALFSRKSDNVQINGDLAEGAAAGSEPVTVSRISPAPQPDRNSPVLLWDSHTLIYHSGGDIHAKDSGLPELLAYELGVNVDLVGGVAR